MREYWEQVHTTRLSESFSWYQQHALRSLSWIAGTGIAGSGEIIDVGGGASTLVDDLLGAGCQNITLLDISSAALQVARQRLGVLAQRIHWCEADITTASLPAQGFDIWHDRAVFHFLTEPADRKAYVAQLQRAVKPGGHVIIAAFSMEGPMRCSGLPIVRYSADTLQTELGSNFQLQESAEEQHVTPAGSTQSFIYCHFVKCN